MLNSVIKKMWRYIIINYHILHTRICSDKILFFPVYIIIEIADYRKHKSEAWKYLGGNLNNDVIVKNWLR